MRDSIIKKFNEKKGIVGIVGLGYVGLPLALRFSETGNKVLGIDVDLRKVNKINTGESYIKYIKGEKIGELVNSGLLEASDDFSRISEVDAIVICVPTPLGKHNEPDLRFIKQTVDTILPYLKKGQVISLESTTYPGTTDEEISTRIVEKGFTPGEDIFIIYSPEREDPGNKKFSTHNIPKVVGGVTENCRLVGEALYEKAIEQVVTVSSTKAAEMTKLLENIFRAVNIGLVNELKVVTDKMGIDIWEVIDAAASKPFGFMPFYPGPGLGGHCIPIDPFYLTWKAREYNFHTRFIELAGEINTAMPSWVLYKVTEALNDREKSVKGSNILILGLSYKKNIDDTRESPSVELIELLLAKGANVSYSDSFIPEFPEMRKHKLDMKSVDIDVKLLAATDCVIIATDHDDFDYDFIKEHSDLVVDTRGRYRESFANVVKA